MQEYYFLFGLAFLWTLFATIQDLKQREVANWISFSLIAFALAYRGFYSIKTSNPSFFLIGLAGLATFIILGYVLYYGRVFAGGDAKLLMSYGTILPFSTINSLIIISIATVFLLLTVGAAYSLLYSIGIVISKNKEFKKEFKKEIRKTKYLALITLAVALFLTFLGFYNSLAFAAALFFVIPLLFTYTKALDKCMIVKLQPNKLTPGDWIEKDIKVSKDITIKKTVHGLTPRDIKILKKHKKSIKVKNGIPFVPAFLITLIIMALFFLASKSYLFSEALLSSLFFQF